MNRIHKTDILTRVVRCRGFTRQELAKGMDISVATLRKYLVAPDLMTGIHRKTMAQVLGIEVTVIDRIANAPQTVPLKTVQTILNTLTEKQWN